MNKRNGTTWVWVPVLALWLGWSAIAMATEDEDGQEVVPSAPDGVVDEPVPWYCDWFGMGC